MTKKIHDPSAVTTMAIISIAYFGYYALLWYFQYLILLLSVIAIIFAIIIFAGLISMCTLKPKDYVTDSEYED